MISAAVLILVVLLGLGVPVAATLGMLGVFLTELYSILPLTRVIGEVSWQTSTQFILLAVPLYIFMGEVLMRSGIAERMYNAMIEWLSWLPGGLMHSNIGFCTMFAATSGSSVATAATVGTVAIPQIEKFGYNERIFLGTLAAGGTLGILIPPSINLIIYGLLTETSIPKLYLAGFLPGFCMAAFFMLIIGFLCWLRPEWGGRPIAGDWRRRRTVLIDLVPPLLIFLVVVGTIYAGIATPTESAALGLLAAFVLAALRRRLTWAVLRQSIEGSLRTTAMTMAIVLAAYFLNFIIGAIGLTEQVNRLVTNLGMSPYQTLLVVIVFYVILGMFMETLSMMVATVPIITPVVVHAGFDPVWFGIVMMLLIETAMITPPVGINLFVVQGIRETGAIKDVMLGAAPFVVALLGMVAVLVLFPDIALFLPRLIK
ncbi:MAG: TRAP transporter large permease [Proteobacteria bacterium]|nr:TRAP transporter large permease [Pseudomonadota bacterium]